MNKIFVYGTLRKGRGNHYLISKSKFIGNAITKNKYHMTSNGGFPYVSNKKETSNVIGEIYEVDESTLSNLDRLEGYNPNNHDGSWYKRTPIEVILENNEIEKVEIYFNDQEGHILVETGDFLKQ